MSLGKSRPFFRSSSKAQALLWHSMCDIDGSCDHQFLQPGPSPDQDGEIWTCVKCQARICCQEQIQVEVSERARVLEEDRRNYRNSNEAALALSQRALCIGWLIEWTNKHDCWEWPTWRVRNDLILPATANAGRCRYSDLLGEELFDVDTPVAGPAHTFISHCWGTLWGDLISAVGEFANPKSRVWIDIFAVRQWPGNVMDLDFRGVMKHCHSFLIYCASPQITEGERNEALQAELAQVAIRRVWCLVEIGAAVTFELPFVLKCGHRMKDVHLENLKERQKTLNRLKNNQNMLGYVNDSQFSMDQTWQAVDHSKRIGAPPFFTDIAMLSTIRLDGCDVRNARASFETDRLRILKEIDDMKGGVHSMNVKIQNSVNAASEVAPLEWSLVFAAACGNGERLKELVDKSDERGNALTLTMLAACGFTGLVNRFLELSPTTPVDTRVDGLNDNFQTALHYAAKFGFVSTMEALVRHGADPTVIDRFGGNALYHAVTSRNLQAVEFLLNVPLVIEDMLKPNDDLSGKLLSERAQSLAWRQSIVYEAIKQAARDESTTIYHASNTKHGSYGILLTLIEKQASLEERIEVPYKDPSNPYLSFCSEVCGSSGDEYSSWSCVLTLLTPQVSLESRQAALEILTSATDDQELDEQTTERCLEACSLILSC